MAGGFFTTGPPRKPQNMNCSEIKHGFYLFFHTPCTDQVLSPISTDYIFHNKSSIPFPLAQGRQAYWAATPPCLCSPCYLGFVHLLGLPESDNHSSRDADQTADQAYGWLICLESKMQPHPSWHHLGPSWHYPPPLHVFSLNIWI